MSSTRFAQELWPEYSPTPLLELPELARLSDVGRVFVKWEADRPLGNFKVLGGMVAAVRALARASHVSLRELHDKSSRLKLPRLICASDGNHGLAVAAAAARCNTAASIYLPMVVSRVRAARIEAQGGKIVWICGTYDDAVREAAAAAAGGEGVLIADTTQDSDDAIVRDVMDGYRVIADELISQFERARQQPSHLFVQAGVGGLAAAMAEGFKHSMLQPRELVIVEPSAAACVTAALNERRVVRVPGNLYTSAEMLSCGIASAAALKVLQAHDVTSVLVDEEALQDAPGRLRRASGLDTTPSGAAGLAGLLHVAQSSQLRALHRLTKTSVVVLLITEGPLTLEEPRNADRAMSVPPHA